MNTMHSNPRQPLEKSLRAALEKTVIKARDIAEAAAAASLNRLGVGEAKAPDYLSDAERTLRTRLRAHGRQLGDVKNANGSQSTHQLRTEVAYEHWHRMLFARFLEQNHLLMYEAGVPLTLHECDELVRDGVYRDEQEQACRNGWELAGVLASKMLPQIFRVESPVFALHFAPEDQRELEHLLHSLAPETFQAQDSLGWVYQFWQSKRKEEVNKSEVKIGADELSPVTQLFTEPYMVSFLLDNSLGAWWAGKRLSDADWKNAQSEQELRDKAAIPGVPLSYLRFVKDESTQQWQPASGTFDAWPKHLSELKTLDPCCGSGHFLVAAFLMLVPMRMQSEQLNARQAIDKVLSENLHGLELDQRCVELAAFAVALEAWRYPDAGSYRLLPRLKISCCGQRLSESLKPQSSKNNQFPALVEALNLLQKQFNDAPILGSLIDVKNALNHESLFEIKWKSIAEALDLSVSDASTVEYAENVYAAHGIIEAAEILSSDYHLIATNVPFRQADDLDESLVRYIKKYFSESKSDLATVFHQRLIRLLPKSGVLAIVQPQGFLYKDYYQRYRKEVFSTLSVPIVARLGAGAFSEITGEEVKVILSIYIKKNPLVDNTICQVSADKLSYDQKADLLVHGDLTVTRIVDAIIGKSSVLSSGVDESLGCLLEENATFSNGIQTGDYPRFGRFIWETNKIHNTWSFQLTTVSQTEPWSGRSSCLNWGCGDLVNFVELKLGEGKAGAWIRGTHLSKSKGVAISAMGSLKATLFNGENFDDNTVVIIPKNPKHLVSLWRFCSSENYDSLVREVDQSSKVRGALLRVNFEPYEADNATLPPIITNDPTQWIFHGHPCGSVIWDEETKWTAKGELRVDDTVLQVAVARLLGYRWPAELDKDMELAEEQRAWVLRCQDLDEHVDDDGIVCLPPVRGEQAADQRLEALLQDAYGKEWTTPLKNRLLETVGSKSLSLWLRDKFFEQHCKLFQNRPFIWHVWDGLKDGFSALVNYHQLDKAGLERLIYTYLGDWIRTQQAGVANGEDGADIRLAAAETLKTELEKILEGEKPYDIFVRWKPLAEQPIGWNPDLNDGVRLNIRPFLQAKDLGKKGAGILRFKPNIKWEKDRGKDVSSAPWYHLGLEYDGKEGDRINDHHLALEEKRAARNKES